MADSSPPSSWTFWRDKKGFEEALDDYYPELSKSNPIIAAARLQMKVAMSAINGEMSRLSKEEFE